MNNMCYLSDQNQKLNPQRLLPAPLLQLLLRLLIIFDGILLLLVLLVHLLSRDCLEITENFNNLLSPPSLLHLSKTTSFTGTPASMLLRRVVTLAVSFICY